MPTQTATPTKSARVITVQFSFTNPDIIPASIRRLEKETQDEAQTRSTRKSGVQVIAPTENCTLAMFATDIMNDGYQIVGASCQRRHDPKNTAKKWHAVRFIFVKVEHVDLDNMHPIFKSDRAMITAAFGNICRESFWRTRLFKNPYYSETEVEVPGEHALSFNFEARIPRFHPNGEFIKARLRDPITKEQIGDPVVLQPAFELRFVDGDSTLAPPRG